MSPACVTRVATASIAMATKGGVHVCVRQPCNSASRITTTNALSSSCASINQFRTGECFGMASCVPTVSCSSVRIALRNSRPWNIGAPPGIPAVVVSSESTYVCEGSAMDWW